MHVGTPNSLRIIRGAGLRPCQTCGLLLFMMVTDDIIKRGVSPCPALPGIRHGKPVMGAVLLLLWNVNETSTLNWTLEPSLPESEAPGCPLGWYYRVRR